MPHKKNDYINNPKTGTPIYGVIPEIRNRSDFFPEGQVFLRYGQHRGPHSGYGAIHILKEHSKELASLNYEVSIDGVAAFVSDIICSYAPIYCEFSSMRNGHRITVIKNSVGLAILEERQDGNNTDFYSVVTAYANTIAKGTMIGKIK